MRERPGPQIDPSVAKIAARDPLFGAALGHLALSQQLHQEGHHAEALREVNSAIRLNPTQSQPHFFKAVILLSLAALDDARRALETALKLKNDDATHWLYLAWLEIELDRPIEAIQALDEALALDPDCAPAHLMRGNLLQSAGRIEEAVDAYQEAVRTNPHLMTARYRLAGALLKLGADSDALRQAIHALRMNTFDPRSRFAAGELLGAQGDVQAALEEYRAAAMVDTRTSPPLWKMGLAHFELGNLAEADRLFQRAVELNPKDMNSWLSLSRVRLALSDHTAAAEFAERALAIDANYPPARELAGQTKALLLNHSPIDAIPTTGKSGSSPSTPRKQAAS